MMKIESCTSADERTLAFLGLLMVVQNNDDRCHCLEIISIISMKDKTMFVDQRKSIYDILSVYHSMRGQLFTNKFALKENSKLNKYLYMYKGCPCI